MSLERKPQGTLSMITGCMYSGKTDKLLKHFFNNQKQGVEKSVLFKHDFDLNTKGNLVKSRTGLSHQARSIHSLGQLDSSLTNAGSGTTIYIDEIQFFPASEFVHILALLQRGIDVVVSGLDKDYLNNYFPISKLVLDRSDNMERVYARCHICGSFATHTHRVAKAKDLFVLDTGDNYEARCNTHFVEGT